MSGDVHVRFSEGLGVKFPRATHPSCNRPEPASPHSHRWTRFRITSTSPRRTASLGRYPSAAFRDPGSSCQGSRGAIA